jgi:hypothetical protein
MNNHPTPEELAASQSLYKPEKYMLKPTPPPGAW